MPVDREANRAAASAAAQHQPAAHAPTAPGGSIADRMVANVGTAAAAAATGNPGAASSQPANPGAPPKPLTYRERVAAIAQATSDKLPVVFNGVEMDLTVEEALRQAQRGMLVENIETERNAMKADREGYAGYQAFTRWLRENPERAALIGEIHSGRLDPAALRRQAESAAPEYTNQDDDSPRVNTSRTEAALAARLEQMERTLQGFQASSNAQSLETRFEQAVSRIPFLKANPEARELAIRNASADIAAGNFPTVDAALHAAASRLERMVNGAVESLRERRVETNQEFHGQVPPIGSPVLPPDFGTIPSGSKGLRDEGVRQGLKNWILSGARAARSGPN